MAISSLKKEFIIPKKAEKHLDKVMSDKTKIKENKNFKVEIK